MQIQPILQACIRTRGISHGVRLAILDAEGLTSPKGTSGKQ
jgi:hypothetical protein